MLLLNFSHPLTDEQLAQVAALTGHPVDRVLDVPVHFDPAQPFTEQVVTLVESVALTSAEWQTLPLLVNPPGHAPLAVTLLAELHGRMGYFPAVVRLRPAPGSTPPRFEVAEVINLQAVRDAARSQR
jgi:hypothetical protein